MKRLKNIIVHFIVNLLSLYAAVIFVDGITLLVGQTTGGKWETLIIAAIVFGLINISLKPLLKLLSIPIQLITFGLFSLVINTIAFMLISFIVPEYAIAGLYAAFLGSIVVSLVHMFVFMFIKK